MGYGSEVTLREPYKRALSSQAKDTFLYCRNDPSTAIEYKNTYNTHCYFKYYLFLIPMLSTVSLAYLNLGRGVELRQSGLCLER